MVKNWIKNNTEMVVSIVAIIALFALVIFGFSGLVKAEASRPTTVDEYEILTVYQYSTPITNGYGGIRGHEVRYHVTFMDNDGNILEKEMYNGATKSDNPYEAVYMGEETKLVVTSKGSTSWYALYLTSADFEAMQYKVIEN